MLPKENRLKRKADFNAVLRERKSFRDGCMLLKARRNGGGASRIGIMLSKKVSKSAVKRNQIRRAMRDELRSRVPEIKKGSDIVFVGLPPLKAASPKKVREITASLLKNFLLL